MSLPNDAAPFPAELISMVRRDRHDGHVTFEYALMSGRQSYVIERVNEMLQGARRTPAKYRKSAVEAAAEFAHRHQETLEEISRQWSAHVEALCARYAARRAVPTAAQDGKAQRTIAA